MNKQAIRSRYKKSGFVLKEIDFESTGSGSSSRVNIKYDKYVCTPKRKNYPKLNEILEFGSLRDFIEIKKDMFFRNKEITELMIGRVRLSERTADQPIKNSWCVSFVDKMTGSRYIYMWVSGTRIMSIITVSER